MSGYPSALDGLADDLVDVDVVVAETQTVRRCWWCRAIARWILDGRGACDRHRHRLEGRAS